MEGGRGAEHCLELTRPTDCQLRGGSRKWPSYQERDILCISFYHRFAHHNRHRGDCLLAAGPDAWRYWSMVDNCCGSDSDMGCS